MDNKAIVLATILTAVVFAAFGAAEVPVGAPKRMPGKCVFNLADLPNPGHYVLTVRPVECFGKKGRPIKTEITVPPGFQM